jgi:hypothetical protein
MVTLNPDFYSDDNCRCHSEKIQPECPVHGEKV